MNRPDCKSPIPDGPPTHLLKPTIRNYFVEWFEDLGSQWNLCSRNLLVEYVLAAFPENLRGRGRQQLEKAVLSHLQTLRKAYFVSKSPQDRKVLSERHKRNRRKREVSSHGAQRYEGWVDRD